jgi:hypothetical protein
VKNLRRNGEETSKAVSQNKKAKAGRGPWVSLRQNSVPYQKMEQSGGEWQKLDKML